MRPRVQGAKPLDDPDVNRSMSDEARTVMPVTRQRIRRLPTPPGDVHGSELHARRHRLPRRGPHLHRNELSGRSCASEVLARRDDRRRISSSGRRPSTRRAGARRPGRRSMAAPAGPPTQRYIFQEECARAETLPIPPFGISMLAPVLMTFGSRGAEGPLPAAHPQRHGLLVPGLFRTGRRLGPRLAQDQGRARRATTTSSTARRPGPRSASTPTGSSSSCRTDPQAKKPQEGISFLLIDMKTPGVEVRPIITMDGGHEVNEIWLNNVKVPVAEPRRQGERRLDLRQISARARTHRHRRRRALQEGHRAPEARSPRSNSTRASRSSAIRNSRKKIAELEIDLSALEYTELRTLARESQGKGPGPGKLDPQDQGHRDPAAHHRADAGSGRQLRRALLPRLPEGWRQPAPDRARLCAPRRADVLQHAQDLDLRRLQRNPAQHHRQDGAGALSACRTSVRMLASGKHSPRQRGKGGRHVGCRIGISRCLGHDHAPVRRRRRLRAFHVFTGFAAPAAHQSDASIPTACRRTSPPPASR